MSGTDSRKKPSATQEDAPHKRHDFTQSTIQRLRDRAGNVCSFPGCSVHTHGAAFTGDKAVGVGKACHIKAAAPGGPRYDTQQTKDQRRHMDNGIWMCGTHSDLIDADDSAYSVETLLDWRRKAEARSNSLIDQKSFTEVEVKAAVDEERISALRQWVDKDSDPINVPIVEIMRGYETGLESLDPRFKVQVDKEGETYQYTISAAQKNASLQLILNDLDQLDGFLEAERALIEEGRELQIPGANFKFEGSKLFEAIHQKSRELGVLRLGPPKRMLSASIYLRTPKGSEKFIDTFTCHYTSGSLRTIFDGVALDGFFIFTASWEHGSGDIKFGLTYSLDAWLDKNICDLPKFMRLLVAVQSLKDGCLVVEFEVGNNVVSFDTKASSINEEFHSSLRWLIEYIDLARKVAQRCDTPILLKTSSFDDETYKALRVYAGLINGPVITNPKTGWLCSSSINADVESEFTELKTAETLCEIKLVPYEAKVFELFGQMVSAPRVERFFTKVEYFLFTDLESRDKPKMAFYSTEDTTVTTELNAEDKWGVSPGVDVFDGAHLAR